jgi:chromosomal replication initiation ATPase DnaA
MEQERRVLFDVLLRRRMGRENFEPWFGTMEVYEATDRLVLIMPTRFHMNWVNSHYRDDILAAAREAWPDVRSVAYVRRKMVRSERGGWDFEPDLSTLYPK